MLFTNPQRRTKLLNVDLLGRTTLIPFSLFLPVPQDDAARCHGRRDACCSAIRDSDVTDYSDLAALRAALERLPAVPAMRAARRRAIR